MEMDSALVPVGLGALRGSRRGAAVGLGVDMDPVQGSGPSLAVGEERGLAEAWGLHGSVCSHCWNSSNTHIQGNNGLERRWA